MNLNDNDILSSSQGVLRQQDASSQKEEDRQHSETKSVQTSKDVKPSHEPQGTSRKSKAKAQREAAAKAKAMEAAAQAYEAAKGKADFKSTKNSDQKGKGDKGKGKPDKKSDPKAEPEKVKPRDNPSRIVREARAKQGLPTHNPSAPPGDKPVASGKAESTSPGNDNSQQAPEQAVTAEEYFTADSCKQMLAEFAGHEYDNCKRGCVCHLEIDKAVAAVNQRREQQKMLAFESSDLAHRRDRLQVGVKEHLTRTANENVQSGLEYIEEPDTPPVLNWRQFLGYSCVLAVAIPLGFKAASSLVRVTPLNLGWATTLGGTTKFSLLPEVVHMRGSKVVLYATKAETIVRAAKAAAFAVCTAVSTYVISNFPKLYLPGRRSYTTVLRDIASDTGVHPQLLAHLASKVLINPDRSMHSMRELNYAADQWVRLNQSQWSETERGSQIYRAVQALGGNTELSLYMYEHWSSPGIDSAYRRLRGYAFGAGIGSKARL